MLTKQDYDLIYDTFKKNDVQYDVYDVKDDEYGCDIIVSVEMGDWKHEHLYLSYLMEQIGYVECDQIVTFEDGGDCYSADHYFKKIS